MPQVVKIEKLKLTKDWNSLLKDEIHQTYFRDLMDFIHEEYRLYTCYPKKNNIFKSLSLTPYKDTKVVILGQDPYHQENQAMGLAFSVPKGTKIPPSLQNIFKELADDLKIDKPKNGDLSKWARQGVLLMNTIWTVRHGQALSHKDKGWERFSDYLLTLLNEKKEAIVFVLWGSHARKKKALITNEKHLIIENVHPSPLSSYRGFFGSKPFSQINNFLIQENQIPIDFRT